MHHGAVSASGAAAADFSKSGRREAGGRAKIHARAFRRARGFIHWSSSLLLLMMMLLLPLLLLLLFSRRVFLLYSSFCVSCSYCEFLFVACPARPASRRAAVVFETRDVARRGIFALSEPCRPSVSQMVSTYRRFSFDFVIRKTQRLIFPFPSPLLYLEHFSSVYIFFDDLSNFFLPLFAFTIPTQRGNENFRFQFTFYLLRVVLEI